MRARVSSVSQTEWSAADTTTGYSAASLVYWFNEAGTRGQKFNSLLLITRRRAYLITSLVSNQFS